MTRHFLRLTDLSPVEARQIVLRASALKNLRDPSFRPFIGKTLAMIFTKSSTRTRVSFEAGMAKFGGHALFLTTATTQLGRDEPRFSARFRVAFGEHKVPYFMLSGTPDQMVATLREFAALGVTHVAVDFAETDPAKVTRLIERFDAEVRAAFL